MASKPLQFGLLISAAMMIGGGYLAQTTQTNIVNGFMKKGWNKALNLKSPATISVFTFKCVMNSSCVTAYTNTMNRRNVYWYAGLALLGFVGTLGFLHAIRKAPKVDPEYVKPGMSRWADREEIPLYISGDTKNPTGNPQRGYLGILRDGTVLAAPEKYRNAHNVVIGGPGAAKSTGYHKPNQILDALQGSVAVVLDLKFPDYEAGFLDMVPLFYEAGRNVQVYAPFTMSSMRLNLLQNARDLEGAYDVASMLLPTKEDEGGAAFYKNIERTLLSTILFGLAHTENSSMQQAFKICLRGASSIREFISSHDDLSVRETAAAMLELDNKTITGISASLANALQIFNHPAVSRATTPKEGETMDIDRFWFEPGLFYIGLEQDQMLGPRGRSFIQILKRLIDNSMLRAAKMRTNPYTGEPKKAGKMPIHVAYYLDEFPAMGVLPDISNSFAMMRSFRVSYHVTLQNLSQAEVLYGRDGFRSFFNNNLQHIMFFPSRTKMDDAKYFSDYLGDTTVTERRYSDSEQKTIFGGGGSKSESWGDAMRKMLSPGQMLSYPPNEAILFVIGSPAVKIVMPGYYEETYQLYEPDPVTGRSIQTGKKFKNPIYRLYKELQKHEPMEFIENVLLGMDKDRPSDEDLELNAVESFQAWAMALIKYGARITTYDKRYIIHTKDLPNIFTDEKQLKAWEAAEWLTYKKGESTITNNGQIIIKKDGLIALGLPLKRELATLRYRGPLMLWIQQNSVLLEDHPSRKYTDAAPAEIAGYYEAEHVLMTPEDAKNIWNGAEPPESMLTKRKGTSYYRIPVDDEEFLIMMSKLAYPNQTSDEESKPSTTEKPQKPTSEPQQTTNVPMQNLTARAQPESVTTGGKNRASVGGPSSTNKPSNGSRGKKSIDGWLTKDDKPK